MRSSYPEYVHPEARRQAIVQIPPLTVPRHSITIVGQSLYNHTRRTSMHKVLAALALTAATLSPSSAAAQYEPARQNIVEIAASAGNFNTLVTAVQAAGLVEVLSGEGPFTVFAPTDEAFARIPAEDLQAILADRDRLTAILTYHVVPGRVLAADVVGLDSAATVNGKAVTITTASDGVRIDGARVTATDIMASNGVIHVIDTVILP